MKSIFYTLLLLLFTSQISWSQTGIYWLNTPTGIERMDKNGENRQTLISWEVSASPQGITMDLEGQKLYWTDWVAKKILRSNFDGSNIEDLLIEGLQLPEGIALDIENQKMYWVDSGSKKIQRANMDGTNMEDLVAYPAVNLDGIAVDSEDEKIYWTLWGAGSAIGQVVRADLDGTNVESLVSVPNGILKGLDLDVEAGKMYWTNCSHSKVQRANLNGTNVEDLVTGLSTPNAVSLDLEHQKMYWTDLGTKRIQRANLDGTAVETIADTLVQSPQDLVVNCDFINALTPTMENNQVQIFPNPTVDFLTIHHAGNVRKIQIFDSLGKSQNTFLNPATTFKVEVSKYPIGFYFIEMTDGQGRQTVEQFQVFR